MSVRAPEVSIVVPTRRRPEPLARALASVMAQRGVDRGRLELIVADNDETGGARALVETLAAKAPFPVVYAHEPKPGVASVRNAAMAAARGELIAFLDDDQEAPAGWLAALLDAQARFDADAVFGPVRAAVPESLGWRRAYLQRFFSRAGPDEAQVTATAYGCGDCLVRRAAMPDARAPFAVSQDQVGGEDDVLFGAMKAAGARFAWAPDAWVWEHPQSDRMTLRYALKRAFAYGQGPPHHQFHGRPRNLPAVAYWMAVGVAQSLVFGTIAAAKWVVRAPDRADALDRAARGLGKVLWFPPFKPRFYGLPTP